MTELLILAILLDKEYTIYKIKQKIKNNFSVFLSASFGSIHPAIEKLEKNGFISAKRKLSSGGQKSSNYSITTAGRKQFKELMTAEITESLASANQLINIKIMLLDLLEESLQKLTINSIKKYLEIHLLNTRELLESIDNQQAKSKDNKTFQQKFLKYYVDKISREIAFVNFF